LDTGANSGTSAQTLCPEFSTTAHPAPVFTATIAALLKRPDDPVPILAFMAPCYSAGA